jgi:hypothetical protein
MGGAFVAAAFALILLALGGGLELSALSPWSNAGASASTLTATAIGWLVFTEVVASALGGYLAGRLRTKWILIHTDEVYFRDTANGFLAWAVALVISVTLLASAATSMAGRVAQSAASEQGGTAASTYFVDTLFRADPAGPESRDAATQAEGGRIFANSLRQDRIPAADGDYLARLIVRKTGISQADAEKRVSDVLADARQTEESARKATARLLIWIFFALIAGAFSSSYAAMIGGRQRDRVQAV